MVATYGLETVKARYLKSIYGEMIGIYTILIIYVDFVTDSDQVLLL